METTSSKKLIENMLKVIYTNKFITLNDTPKIRIGSGGKVSSYEFKVKSMEDNKKTVVSFDINSIYIGWNFTYIECKTEDEELWSMPKVVMITN